MEKIYLDNNSTTKIDAEVLDSMLPFFVTKYGNPSSNSHIFGWEAKAAIDLAREQVAKLINANSDEIIFTSGATESNNLAIYGYCLKNQLENSNIITSSIEHLAVLDVFKKIDFDKKSKAIFIKPNQNGIINISELKKAITNRTTLISVMHANNEIGTIQPIKEIGKLCLDKNIIFHVDAAQSLGKIKIDVLEMNIDLLSISSHKIYGPKGIGALYIKDKTKKIELNALIVGGGQEKNYRSGTLATPLIVGFGRACQICLKNMKDENQRIQKMRNRLAKSILTFYPDTKINGSLERRIPGNINFTFPFLHGVSIIPLIPNLAVSNGSACSSSDPSPSHVLSQIGISKKNANSSLRIGIGRFNKEKDIDIAIESIKNALRKK